MTEAYPSGKDFVVAFNLDSCLIRYVKYKMIPEAYLSGKIKIIELVQCYSEELVLSWVQALLVSFSAYMDFTITPQQAKITAMLLVEELYFLNIVELTLFFKFLSKGQYGEFYGKFNGQIIISACRQYRHKRGLFLSSLKDKDLSE